EGAGDGMTDRLWVDEAVDRLDGRDAGAGEDGGDDEVTGALLGREGAQQERGAEGERGERVAEVVDEVGEQGDARCGDEHRDLRQRGETEHEPSFSRSRICTRLGVESTCMHSATTRAVSASSLAARVLPATP